MFDLIHMWRKWKITNEHNTRYQGWIFDMDHHGILIVFYSGPGHTIGYKHFDKRCSVLADICYFVIHCKIQKKKLQILDNGVLYCIVIRTVELCWK